jgi:Aminotransferase class-III
MRVTLFGAIEAVVYCSVVMADLSAIDAERVRALLEGENARFVAERPRSMTLLERARGSMPRGVPMSWMDDLYEHPPVWVSHGAGAFFTDVDEHRYLDMYVADMSAFCGHAPTAVVDAVSAQIARGNQFLLPSEDAIVVAEHLATRYGLPQWQFTSSATQANTEVIRIAREMTGRGRILLFDASTTARPTPPWSCCRTARSFPRCAACPVGSAAKLASSRSTTSRRSKGRSRATTSPSSSRNPR